MEVVTPDPEVFALLPTLLPEYWAPMSRLAAPPGTGTTPTRVRVDVVAEGDRYHVVENQTVVERPRWDDLPGTLEFVLARSLIRDSGAEALLHGAGLSIGGEGLLLVGPSGRGKSSLAIQLAGLGHPLITDDFLLIHEGGRVEGARRHAKLDTQTLDSLNIDPESTVHWHTGAGEAWIDPEELGGWARQPLVVRWLVFLGPDRSTDALQRISEARAIELLLESRAPDRGGRSLKVLTELLEGSEALELSASSHASALSLVMKGIASHP